MGVNGVDRTENFEKSNNLLLEGSNIKLQN